MTETAEVRRDVIAGISGHPMSGLWTLAFESGTMVYIESGFGVRVLASCFGARDGDLLEKITGQDIYYSVDPYMPLILAAFTPAEEWEGEEIPMGGMAEIGGEETDAEV